MENFHLKNNSVGRWINHTIRVRLEFQLLDTMTTAEVANVGDKDTAMASYFISVGLRWKLQNESNEKKKNIVQIVNSEKKTPDEENLVIGAINGVRFSIWCIARRMMTTTYQPSFKQHFFQSFTLVRCTSGFVCEMRDAILPTIATFSAQLSWANCENRQSCLYIERAVPLTQRWCARHPVDVLQNWRFRSFHWNIALMEIVQWLQTLCERKKTAQRYFMRMPPHVREVNRATERAASVR